MSSSCPNVRSLRRDLWVRLVTGTYATGSTGGLEITIFQACRELVRRGRQVDLLYVKPGSFLPRYEDFCRSVAQVSTIDYWYPTGRRGRPLAMAKMAPAIAEAARRRPDVVYAHRIQSCGWAIPTGMLVRSPVVCHEHGHSDHLSPHRIDFINHHVQAFIMPSQYVADLWLDSGLDPAKVSVAHNGIDPAEYPVGGLVERSVQRKALGIPEDAFVAVYIGRLDREKGVDVLLKAWRRLGLDSARARLLVVGSATALHLAAAYRRELDELVSDGVQFLPNTDDVTAPLHAADVAVLPSEWEAFGRTVIEALSTGRPVLASRVGGMPEILAGPLDRFLFERGNDVELAQQLRDIMNWRRDEPALAEMGPARVGQAFTLDRMVDAVEGVFDAVTGVTEHH
jgi:glycosyltransferase involved in cell wall biosynthesis